MSRFAGGSSGGRPGPAGSRPDARLGGPGAGAPGAVGGSGSDPGRPAAAPRGLTIGALTVLMAAASGGTAAEVCLPLPAPGGEPSRRALTLAPFGALTLVGSRQGQRLEVRVLDASGKPSARGAGVLGIERLPVYLRVGADLRVLEVVWRERCPD